MAMGKNVKAREIYETICSMFDSIEWTYDRNDDDLVVETGVKSDDLPIDFKLIVHEENELVLLISNLPFGIPEDKRIDIALAISAINHQLLDGSFDYNYLTGDISFRLTSSYKDSQISENLYEYMVMVSANTIDEYNDKLFLISKGMIKISDFLAQMLK